MSRFKNEVLHLKSHIRTLRIGCAVLALLAAGFWIGWLRAPESLTIHVPPDLRSGSMRKWWEVPPENVYAFGLYIFQQINRWPKDGEKDYERNLYRYQSYLTPGCQAFLQADLEAKRSLGELRKRSRGVYEIAGRGYGDDPTFRVKTYSDSDWLVTLDINADEYYGSEPVKRVTVRYPLHIVRVDQDPETNPWGLVWDCYKGTPQRLEAGGL